MIEPPEQGGLRSLASYRGIHKKTTNHSCLPFLVVTIRNTQIFDEDERVKIYYLRAEESAD